MGRQPGEDILLEGGPQGGAVFQLVAPEALLEGTDQLHGGLDADIGGDQDLLQLLQRIGVNFLFTEHQRINAPHQTVCGLLQPLFQAFEEALLLLLRSRVCSAGSGRARRLVRLFTGNSADQTAEKTLLFWHLHQISSFSSAIAQRKCRNATAIGQERPTCITSE